MTNHSETDEFSARRPDGADAPSASWFDEIAAVIRDAARHLWAQARDRDAAGWPPAWLVYAAVTLTVGLVLLVLVPVLHGLLVGAGRLVQAGGEWLHGWAFTAVVTEPVRRYLLDHAAGLPVSGPALWWTWCTAAAVLFLLALFGSVGARWGWAVFGAATTAMVAAATAPTGRWVAAGVTLVWWSVLSVLAYHRRPVRVRLAGRWPRLASLPVEPAPTEPATQAPAGAPLFEPEPRDEAAKAARVYEKLLRRQLLADTLYGASSSSWTAASTGDGLGFTAVEAETGQVVAGRAITPEAAPVLLAGLSTPLGAVPLVRWQVSPPPPLQLLRTRNRHAPDLVTPLSEFIRDSGEQLAVVRKAVLELRPRWDLERLEEEIAAHAADLNRTHPFPVRESLMPTANADRANPGNVQTYAWVDPVTIVGGNAAHWNDFSDHRPDIVGLIIRAMLTTNNVDAALEDILSEGNGLHLTRTPGPAGPLHDVGCNGTHRAHALRILGVPLVAAELFVPLLPLRLSERDVWTQRHNKTMGRIWRALIERNILVGDVHDTASGGAVVEPHHIAAPWLLHDPDTAASISAAYNRVYPGALEQLGIPTTAITTGENWLRWLRVT